MSEAVEALMTKWWAGEFAGAESDLVYALNQIVQAARNEATEALERDLLGLLRGEWSSLTLGMNEPNAANYMTVEQAADDEVMFGLTDWISEEEKAKAIANNRAWTLQWYPETPVVFHRIAASSLSAIVDYVRANEGKQN